MGRYPVAADASALVRETQAAAARNAARPTPLGRPPVPVDETLVIALAAGLGTYADIAAEVGVSEATLRRRFSVQIERARAATLNRIRSKQVALALSGSERMLIHVGRAEARQKYIEARELSGPDGEPIEFDGELIMRATGRELDRSTVVDEDEASIA